MNIDAYFENLTIELYVLYILNMHVKLHINWTGAAQCMIQGGQRTILILEFFLYLKKK